MAGGIGIPVAPSVAAQIAARQRVIGKKANRTNEDLLYMNSKTGWIKLSSAVNTLSPGQQSLLKQGVDPNTVLGNSARAKANILLGGLLAPNGALRQGIDTTGGYNLNAAYNNRADNTGIRPMPGITSMNVKSKNTYGTLREAEVKFMCWTLQDFEAMEELYLRPGYTVLLEWGHSMYIDNSGNLQKDVQTVGDMFFLDGTTMCQLTNRIGEIRKAADNNYEAMIGYVKNFSWSYTPDGGYSCSVSIISTGEILESIQLRFDPAQRGAVLEDPTTDVGKEQGKGSYHYFISKMASITDRANINIPTIREQLGPIGDRLLLDSLVYYQKVTFDESWGWDSATEMHWIPLRLYFDIFNTMVVPVDTTKAQGTCSRTLTRFNTDYAKSSKFLTSPEHFSINPSTCVLAKPGNLTTEDVIQVDAVHEKGAAPIGELDDVLNIYISLPFLKSTLDDALDESGKINKSMHDITETILEEINTCLGGINDLGLAYDDEDEGGTWYVVDRNNTPEDSSNLPIFPLAGIDSVFTDVGISSTISNEIGAQISIAAQGSTSGTTEYVENILKWNAGTVDRIKVIKTTIDTPDANAIKSAAAVKKEQDERAATWLEDVKTFFDNFNSFQGYEKEEMEAAKTMHAEWTVANVVTKYRTQIKSSLPGLVPVELSFKTDGIGGFIIGQGFKIGAGILPDKYQERFGYIVNNIEHSIDSSNRWETSIGTQFYPIDKPLEIEVQRAGEAAVVTKRDAANEEASKKRKGSGSKSTQKVIQKYGTPNETGAGYLVKIQLPYPMRISWNTKSTVTTIMCHKDVAEQFKAIFTDILDVYGLKRIQELGIDLFGGCFNYRKMRGGDSLSMHSWGIAIDLDPIRNSLNATAKTATFAKPEYKPMIAAFYRHGFQSLGRERDYDWMHFEVKI